MKLALTLTLLALTAHAVVTLPKVFSSHMVLQRDMPIHIWGEAEPGEQVSIDLHGATASTTADTLHRWSIYLPPQSAGGPFTLTIHATNTLTLDDILAAVDAIESDYAGNCVAAREIAAEFFSAEKVIGSLMDRAGLS